MAIDFIRYKQAVDTTDVYYSNLSNWAYSEEKNETYKFFRPGGLFTEDRFAFKQYKSRKFFNENGNVLQERLVDSSEKTIKVTLYDYDDNGKLCSKSTDYENDGNFDHIVEYDANGKKQSEYMIENGEVVSFLDKRIAN